MPLWAAGRPVPGFHGLHFGGVNISPGGANGSPENRIPLCFLRRKVARDVQDQLCVAGALTRIPDSRERVG